jgi:outer membrane protein OmpA-like peptidoglycan-associated protein
VIQPPAPKPVAVAPAPIQYESIELKVLFDNDKSLVKPNYYPEVKRVADFMARHPEVRATIEGHTDSNASDAYNVALSQRRVDTVKKLLIEKYGIQANRLNSVGYGESRPVATNATAEGRQQNRRVIAVFQAN